MPLTTQEAMLRVLEKASWRCPRAGSPRARPGPLCGKSGCRGEGQGLSCQPGHQNRLRSFRSRPEGASGEEDTGLYSQGALRAKSLAPGQFPLAVSGLGTEE